jgi:serine/threonine protein kinase
MSRSSARREPSGARNAGGPKAVGNYTLLDVLGQGTFGEVLLGVERHTREPVAVKVLEWDKICDDDARQRLANEISILHRVHHAHLLQLLEVTMSPSICAHPNRLPNAAIAQPPRYCSFRSSRRLTGSIW